ENPPKNERRCTPLVPPKCGLYLAGSGPSGQFGERFGARSVNFRFPFRQAVCAFVRHCPHTYVMHEALDITAAQRVSSTTFRPLMRIRNGCRDATRTSDIEPSTLARHGNTCTNCLSISLRQTRLPQSS